MMQNDVVKERAISMAVEAQNGRRKNGPRRRFVAIRTLRWKRSLPIKR
jgi:hypothetical protein